MDMQYEGKVIIDPARYVREKGTSVEESEWKDDTDTRWTQGGDQFKSFMKINPKDTKFTPTKDHYILTPPHIRGFTLDARDQREWGQYKVSGSMTLVVVNQPLAVFLEVTNIRPCEQFRWVAFPNCTDCIVCQTSRTGNSSTRSQSILTISR